MRFSALFLLPLLACSSPASPATEAALPARGIFPPLSPSSASQQVPPLAEDFEAGSKGAYAEADEPLGTGSWHFTDALIGSAGQDHKAGQQAARLRGQGRLRMNFDAPAGVRRIRISAAAYGTDAPSTWELWLSRDHGRSWQRNGQPVTTRGATLQTTVFAGIAAAPVRLEIRKTSGADTRLNIDDVVLETGPPAGGSGPAPAAAPLAAAANAACPDNDHLALGNPSGATSDPANATNYLLRRPQFATGYNARRGTPTWTCWHLSRADFPGTAPRQDDFRPDPALPREFYAVTPRSYAGSGFDKGHNCPSGDRTATLDDNSATFLMSNMLPQAPNNNQKTWNQLEAWTRTQVEKGQEAYVLMGGYGRGGTGSQGLAQTLDQGRVTVPARLWKVVVLLPEGPNDVQRLAAGQGRIVAVDTPNDNAVSPDWRQYLTSIDKIEAASGLDLLSALPVAAQARRQRVVDNGQ